MRKIVIEAIITKTAKNFTELTSNFDHKFSNGAMTAWTKEIDSVEAGIEVMSQLEANGIGYKVWAVENRKLLKLDDSEKKEYGKPIYMAWKTLIELMEEQ
jgi:hypothetical protein